jgi:hypothetical protein
MEWGMNQSAAMSIIGLALLHRVAWGPIPMTQKKIFINRDMLLFFGD